MDQVPTLPVQENLPESQKRSKVAMAILVIILLLLPVGVYITLRSNNDVRSNASEGETTTQPETAIQLLSPETSVNNQTVFPVDVTIRSDQTVANFVSAHIDFPPSQLEVVSIATTTVDLNDQTKEFVAQEWVDVSFDNQQGVINLAGGNPAGIKTSGLPDQKKSVLATIFLKARSPGEADITLQPGSMMLSAENSSNIPFNAKSLKVSIKDSIGDFAEKSYEAQAAIFNKPKIATSESSLVLQSPIGGEVFSYYNPITIKWQTVGALENKNTKPVTSIPGLVTISLLMNGEFLGQLTEQPTNVNEYIWNPNKTLPLDYIKSENSFKIELQSVINGKREQVTSLGPFSILTGNITARQLTESELGADRTDLTGDGSIDFRDVSYLLAQYYKPVTLTNKKSDLNNDLEINDIDLWFLSKALHL